MKPSIIMACLISGTATLGACSIPDPGCSTTYRGGCVPNTAGLAAVTPGPATPAIPKPATTATPFIPGPATTAAPSIPGFAATTPANQSPAAVPIGDPSGFANVDDKQCRSYGLTFGSRDYADCRIRLSAQHRGLDPDTGATR